MNAALTLETVRTLLGWCAIGNLVLVLVWFALFRFAHDALLAWHGGWFKFSPQTFDAIHYSGLAIYKVLTWMLFIIPYLVLRLAF
jgi:hypothetical protein